MGLFGRKGLWGCLCGGAVGRSVWSFWCLILVLWGSSEGLCQSSETRVLWRLEYDAALDGGQRAAVESSVLKTLARASERHFVGQKILDQKLRTEGVNFPECFTDGVACATGGAFVLDVYGVDAYVVASFAHEGGEWGLDLTVYRRLSSSAVHVRRTAPGLSELLQSVLGSLFEMESEMDVTAEQGDVEVYVNRRFVGKAPLSLRIPVGVQEVWFKKPGYVDQTWEFEAEKGRLYSRHVALVPEVTRLTVLTPVAESQVYVDGALWSEGNVSQEILPGDHLITVSADGYHAFEQDYRVYPGNPQTIQVALLKESESPYGVRHRNISKYRFSGTVGYRYAHQSLSMKGSRVELVADGEGHSYGPERGGWGEGSFHGVTLGLNYEDTYWGIGLFKLDILGSSLNKSDEIVFKSLGAGDPGVGRPHDGLLVGFYPLQAKGHYTFWVMQAEAVFGVGVSHLRVSGTTPFDKFTLKQTAFSINFDVMLKYYLSEESYVSAGYELQYDVKGGERARHGLSVMFGFQFPLWMRETGHGVDSMNTEGVGPEAGDVETSFELRDETEAEVSAEEVAGGMP